MSSLQQELTREEVNGRIVSSLEFAISSREDSLIIAPPASGKSRLLFQIIRDFEVPVLYTTSLTDLNEQAERWSEEYELNPAILPTMSEDCVSWESEQLQRAYSRGASPREIHESGLCDEGLECPYIRNIPSIEGERGSGNEHVPKTEAQVLIGHPAHSNVFPYVNDRVVIFDDAEATDAFLEEYRDIEALCQAYFDDSRFPADTAEQLYELHNSGEEKEEALELIEEIDIDVFDEGTTSRVAPKIIRTVLEHDRLDNGYGHFPGPPNERYWGVTDGSHGVHLLEYPELRASEVVIGLDAYPMLWTDEELPVWHWMWTGMKLKSKKILSEEESRRFTENILGIEVIQTTSDAKHYKSGKWVAQEKDQKLIEFISKQHDGTEVPVISSKRALEQLDVEKSMNFSETKSRNDFEKEDLGAVIGSPHLGDDHIQLVGAFMRQSIDSTDERGMNKDYGESGNAILHNMREDMVAQAIHRFGRHPDVDSSTVYVHTGAIPDTIPIAETPRWSTKNYADCENQILIVLERSDEPLTIEEISKETTCSYDRVRKLVQKLEILGDVQQYESSGGLHNLTDEADDRLAKKYLLDD